MNDDNNIPVIDENGEKIKEMTESQKLDKIIDILEKILEYCKN
jgi:hypothetical protein